MANTIKIKRSAVAGKAPVVGDLDLGELALNTYDGKLYTKRDNGTASIVELSGGAITTVTAVSKTLVDRERCTVTASGQTITLPATPAAGAEVAVTVAGTFTDTILARNGSNIMNLAENITIDVADVSVTVYYVDATRGWRII